MIPRSRIFLWSLAFCLVWRLSSLAEQHDVSCEKLLPGHVYVQTFADQALNAIVRPRLSVTYNRSYNTVSFGVHQGAYGYGNGHSYDTALLLSVLLGMFGIDRFYLGYPAIGLLKFCTLGFFFLFQLVDIILIAAQIVGPADGSHYVVDYYGPALKHITKDINTVYKEQNIS